MVGVGVGVNDEVIVGDGTAVDVGPGVGVGTGSIVGVTRLGAFCETSTSISPSIVGVGTSTVGISPIGAGGSTVEHPINIRVSDTTKLTLSNCMQTS